MTIVYFVRHAESNYNNHDDLLRELTEKGLKDSKLVTQFLSDKEIDIAFSNGAKLHEHLGWETYFTESSPNKTTLEYCNDGPYCQFIIETIPEHK